MSKVEPVDQIIPDPWLIESLRFAELMEDGHVKSGDLTPRMEDMLGCLYTENQRGRIGETGTHLKTGLPLDMEIKKTDNGIDFIIPVTGETIDVKTSHRKSPTSKFDLLVKNTDVERKHVPDFYIHAEIIGKNLIRFHGWTCGSDVRRWPTEKSRLGGVKFNYVKRYGELFPISLFFEYIKIGSRA